MLNSYEMACKTAQNFLQEFLKKYVCTSSLITVHHLCMYCD